MNIDWHGINNETESGWKYPYINTDTGTWWQWSEEQNAYVNTEVNALGYTGSTGPQGERGPKGEDGTSVSVLDISESSVDGGANVVTFSDGHTLTIRNGNTGLQGMPGFPGQDAESFPTPPSSNGTYKLTCVVANGEPTYSWVTE